MRLDSSKGLAKIEIEEGFVDVTLPIVDFLVKPNGVVSITSRGVLNEVEIGLIVDLMPEWTSKVINNYLTFYWGKARFRSLGAASNCFLQVLSAKYEMPVTSVFMVDFISLTAVGLNSDPRRVATDPLVMKCFFEPGTVEAHAEVFVNVNIGEKKLEFREKDPEYRRPLIAALGGACKLG